MLEINKCWKVFIGIVGVLLYSLKYIKYIVYVFLDWEVVGIWNF